MAETVIFASVSTPVQGRNQQQLSKKTSKYIDKTIAMLCKLDDLWNGGSFEGYQKLQGLMFPAGVLLEPEVDDLRYFVEYQRVTSRIKQKRQLIFISCRFQSE